MATVTAIVEVFDIKRVIRFTVDAKCDLFLHPWPHQPTRCPRQSLNRMGDSVMQTLSSVIKAEARKRNIPYYNISLRDKEPRDLGGIPYPESFDSTAYADAPVDADTIDRSNVDLALWQLLVNNGKLEARRLA